MKILLLGAGGFIGANLTERLVKDGKHQITALDIDREKLDETVKSGAVNYIDFDIREGEANLSEPEDKELDRLDTAWDLRTSSRLGCQAVIKGDVIAEFPLYTRNYVQEGGAIQLGDVKKKEEEARP
jgi:nucleoside-diphosphate-sugar epimerase